MKPTAFAMSQRPNQGLRWVVIDQDLLGQALSQHAQSADSVDVRADGYGFGEELVSDLARDRGLLVGGTDSRWLSLAHHLGAHKLFGQVVNVKPLPAGSPVSYGGHYLTRSDTTVALCAVGFADGVPRLNPVGGVVNVGGQRCQIAGRIAMDQMIIDVGDTAVEIGDPVAIWGDGVSVQEWSQWSGRSVELITSTLSPRVVRTIVGSSRG